MLRKLVMWYLKRHPIKVGVLVVAADPIHPCCGDPIPFITVMEEFSGAQVDKRLWAKPDSEWGRKYKIPSNELGVKVMVRL